MILIIFFLGVLWLITNFGILFLLKKILIVVKTIVDFGGNVKALEDFCDLGIDTQTLLSLNDQEFLNLYNNTFVPMWQIAVNMGFETWHQKELNLKKEVR